MKDDLIVSCQDETLKGMLNGYLSTILLTKQRSNNRPILISKCMSCDIVGDCEKNQGVESYLEA